MKKHLPLTKPTTLKLRLESLRQLEGKDLVAVAAAMSVHSLNGGRNCDPGNTTTLC